MMEKLIFIKQKKSQGIYDETGYYFKDEFLNRYKAKAIEILRKRVIEAGNGNFEAGKDKALDEWEVIHDEYLKSVETTKKINQSKKWYWDKLKKRTLQRKINRLNEKIEDIKNQKEDAIKFHEERIEKVQEEIKLVEQGLKHEC